jgi:hypothetical protein
MEALENIPPSNYFFYKFQLWPITNISSAFKLRIQFARIYLFDKDVKFEGIYLPHPLCSKRSPGIYI